MRNTKKDHARTLVRLTRKQLGAAERDYHNAPSFETRAALDDAREELATARERLAYLEGVAEQ